MSRLAGQTAWISGGTSGIGEGAALVFLEEGASVCIADVAAERGKKLEREWNAKFPRRVLFTRCDVTKEAEVNKSIDAAAKKFGGLQILVNNAGIVHIGMLHETTEAEWDRQMDVNVKGAFFATKHAHPHLTKNQRSYIVNVGSISSFVGQAKTPVYTTSKHAILGLTRSIALDYAAEGVRCNCVCPGITDTPLLRHHINATPDPEATLRNRLKRVCMGVPLYPRDIGKAILYFACEDSAGITGTSLTVDCGYLTAAEWEHPGHTRFMEPRHKDPELKHKGHKEHKGKRSGK
jgi:NAD(P)-dependent dehydrogenase (short-subunit alcohol dehydrogenase family)